MLHLADVTGQRSAIDAILARKAIARKECVLIHNSGGMGTSWAMCEAGVEWERQGGCALKATGAAIIPPRALLPWLLIRSPAREALARREVLVGVAVEAAKAVPVVGDAASYLVAEVLKHRRKGVDRNTQFLSEKEQDLLFVIQTATGNRRLVLLIDQLATWDEDSWGLLELILSPVLHDFYPALASALVVLDVSEPVMDRCRKLAEPWANFDLRLNRLRREDAALALTALAFPRLEEAEIDLVFEATGGRLDLLRDLSGLAQQAGPQGFHGEKSELYQKLLARRLRALRSNVASIEEILAAASFIGATSSREEVGCLTGCPPDTLEIALREAELERLIEVADGFVTLRSDDLQRHFRTAIGDELERYHAKFAECLRRLRPGDYATRGHHLSLGQRPSEAAVCYCQAALQDRRLRRTREANPPIIGSAEWGEYRSYLNTMLRAHDAHDRDDLRGAISLLDAIESILPDPLLAERDYLEAQLRMKSHRVTDLERAATLLEKWQSLRETEGELWSRMSQSLLVAWAETQRLDAAIALEDSLTKHYSVRRGLDPWALHALNCLRGRAECLHQLPSARQRLEMAVTYFGPAVGGGIPRHPLHYYYTLTNLVANLIASGSYSRAFARAMDLERQVQAHPNFPWPSLEVAANDSVLAAYLAGELPAPAAVSLLRAINDQRLEIGDRVLVQNNLAVMLIHGGKPKEARTLLESTLASMTPAADYDSYHRYFIGSNLAGLMAVAGETSQAQHMWAEIGEGLPALYPAVRETLLRRHALLGAAIQSAATMSTNEYDACLRSRHPPQLGPQWDFYGRGFLFSDIQFWTPD